MLCLRLFLFRDWLSSFTFFSDFYPSKSQADSQYDVDGDTEEDSSTDEELPAFQEACTGYKKQTSRQRTHSVPPVMSHSPVVWSAGYPALPYIPQSHRPASCPLYYSLTPWSSASSLGMFPSFPVSTRDPQDMASLQKSHSTQQGLGGIICFDERAFGVKISNLCCFTPSTAFNLVQFKTVFFVLSFLLHFLSFFIHLLFKSIL